VIQHCIIVLRLLVEISKLLIADCNINATDILLLNISNRSNELSFFVDCYKHKQQTAIGNKIYEYFIEIKESLIECHGGNKFNSHLPIFVDEVLERTLEYCGLNPFFDVNNEDDILSNIMFQPVNIFHDDNPLVYYKGRYNVWNYWYKFMSKNK